MGRICGRLPDHPLCVEKEVTHGKNISRLMSNGEYHLDYFSRACKKKNWNIKVKKSQERNMQIDLKKKTQNVKTFVH